MHIDTAPIHIREISDAVSSLRFNKASGGDDILAEFYTALVDDGENEASSYISYFCKQVWSKKTIPHQWHVARIAIMFKKGDMGGCSNCKLISIIVDAYKILAHIILHWLKSSGADQRILQN